MSNSKKPRLLIISHDKIGTKMAGPGIRYHYMAETLSSSFDVTIGFFDESYLPDASFKRSYSVKHIDAYYFESGFSDFKSIIALYLTSSMLHYCNINNIFVVFDLYAPVPVENLAVRIFGTKKLSVSMDLEYKESLNMYRQFFENGDLFLCSNKRQLDFWIGYVFGAGQIVPSTYHKRPMYDRFIYAPMGIDTKTKINKNAKLVMKGVLKGINSTDKVVLWTGGIWDWFDGVTLIKAMDILKTTDPSIKLVFLGTQHPNSSIPEMSESLRTRKLAEELGLVDNSVFFKDGWVDYHERIEFLYEADLAIYTHKPSIESEFSHRTRVIDHILAELPTIATEGDYFADDVIKNKLGLVCKPNDPEAIASAILEALKPKLYHEIKQNIKDVRAQYDWSQTLNELRLVLESNPSKLVRLLSIAPPRNDSYPRRIIKKLLPGPMKKVIVVIIKKVKS